MLKEDLFIELINKGVDFFDVTNHDNIEKPELTLLEKKYPINIKVIKGRDIQKIDRAGKIFKRGVTLGIPCLRPSRDMVINWKGDVLLCCQDFYGEYVMGNVHDNSLLEIWNNQRFIEYRRKLSAGNRKMIPICKYCDYPYEAAPSFGPLLMKKFGFFKT